MTGDGVPVDHVDLFDEDALLDPYPHYQRLRDLGSVVWLAQHDLYAIPRYEDVRAVLGDPAVFCSGRGVALNDFVNEAGQGTTLASDGELHDHLRRIIGKRLTPKAVSSMRAEVTAAAEAVVDELLERGEFDAVTDLAQRLPMSVVPDMLGWPDEGRHHLLEWGSATFDAMGPSNQRAQRALPTVLEMIEFANHTAATGNLTPGSVGAGILDARDRGDVTAQQCPMLLVDYLGPSLDTTISAIGSAIWLFANHPDQWDLVRRDTGRIPAAFNEALRLETPISSFSRVATRETDIAGVHVPEGARVLVMFASANRDERRWDRPETFDCARNAAAHVGFGYGVHACAGAGLARLEAHAILGALAARVRRFELGTPIRQTNNLIRAFASLPVSVRPG